MAYYNHPIDGGIVRWTWMTREEDQPTRAHRHDPTTEIVPLAHLRLEMLPDSGLFSPEQRALAAVNSVLHHLAA